MNKPSYIQIFESLTEQIENGTYKPGDKLPSERDLSKQLGVSRMTLREALDELDGHGMLDRRQGSGTYIAEPKLEQQVDVLVGFSEAMLQRGLKPGARLLSLEKAPASKQIAALLQLGIGQPLYYIHRLRTVNGEPMALEHSYFPAHICEGIEEYDLTSESIYALLEKEYGVTLEAAEHILEPVVANAYESEVLAVRPGAPLMLVRRIAFDAEGRPIEYAKDIYRGDRSRFVSRSRLRGKAQ